MIDLDAIEMAMPPAESKGLYVRPSHVAVGYDDLATLLALARAGRRLYEAGGEMLERIVTSGDDMLSHVEQERSGATHDVMDSDLWRAALVAFREADA